MDTEDDHELDDDMQLCEDALEEDPGNDFAKSCARQVEGGRFLSDKQRHVLMEIVRESWEGGLDEL